MNCYISEKDPKFLKTKFTLRRNFLCNKVAYPYESFNSVDDHQKPPNNLEKEELFSISKNDDPCDEEKEKTKKIIKKIISFNLANAEESTESHLKWYNIT